MTISREPGPSRSFARTGVMEPRLAIVTLCRDASVTPAPPLRAAGLEVSVTLCNRRGHRLVAPVRRRSRARAGGPGYRAWSPGALRRRAGRDTAFVPGDVLDLRAEPVVSIGCQPSDAHQRGRTHVCIIADRPDPLPPGEADGRLAALLGRRWRSGRPIRASGGMSGTRWGR
jgi:hypothetical protein